MTAFVCPVWLDAVLECFRPCPCSKEQHIGRFDSCIFPLECGCPSLQTYVLLPDWTLTCKTCNMQPPKTRSSYPSRHGRLEWFYVSFSCMARKNTTMSCQFVAVSVRCGCHPILTVSKDCCLCWYTVLWITVVRYTQPPRRVFRGADGHRAFGIQVALVLATKTGCSYLEPAQRQGQTLWGRQTRWKAWVRWFRFGM